MRQPLESYLRICRRCDEFYKTTSRHSKVCPDCNDSREYKRYRRLKQNDKRI